MTAINLNEDWYNFKIKFKKESSSKVSYSFEFFSKVAQINPNLKVTDEHLILNFQELV